MIRMDDQRFDIGYIGQQGEYLQVVDKVVCFRTSAMDFKRKDGAGTFGEIFLIEGRGRRHNSLQIEPPPPVTIMIFPET